MNHYGHSASMYGSADSQHHYPASHQMDHSHLANFAAAAGSAPPGFAAPAVHDPYAMAAAQHYAQAQMYNRALAAQQMYGRHSYPGAAAAAGHPHMPLDPALESLFGLNAGAAAAFPAGMPAAYNYPGAAAVAHAAAGAAAATSSSDPASPPAVPAYGAAASAAAARAMELPRRERFFVRRNGGTTEEEVITSQKFLATFRVGIPHAHEFGAAKRIIGPAGRNMKLIASMIMGGKVRLRGEGFQDKDQNHPLQLNISCPTKEGYVIAKTLVSKLLKQLLVDFHEFTQGKVVAQMRGNDHPMNPEIPPGWDREFMRGYYSNLVDQVIFVTTIPRSGSASNQSSKKTSSSKVSKNGTSSQSEKGASDSTPSTAAEATPAGASNKPKVDYQKISMVSSDSTRAEISTSADEEAETSSTNTPAEKKPFAVDTSSGFDDAAAKIEEAVAGLVCQ
ncbi:unnamed protein product [Amoebophrya sp. A120]|nr:unnamed protein product [Amoebophrya sp. A120]|eukprot:GSA120T00007824001.1